MSSLTRPTAGSVTFGYSGSLVTSLTVAGPHSVSNGSSTIWTGSLPGGVLLAYDNAFNVKSVDVRGATGAPNGFAAQYVRDRDDLITSVAPLNMGTRVPTLTLTRSPLDGRVTATAFGLVTSTHDSDVSSTTPGHGELSALGAKVNGSDVFAQHYQRDDLGRISRVDETIQGVASTRQYEYDLAGRLSRVRDGAGALLSEYDYDGNGARTRVRTATQELDLGTNLGCGPNLGDPVDAQDRLCRYGDYTYAYNANGQLASKTHLTTGDSTQYTYDGSGLLKSVTTPTRRIDYAYDALGRRIGRIVDGTLQKGWLHQDGLRPVAQLNASGQVESTFVYATKPNVPEYMVVRTTGLYWFSVNETAVVTC